MKRAVNLVRIIVGGVNKSWQLVKSRYTGAGINDVESFCSSMVEQRPDKS